MDKNTVKTNLHKVTDKIVDGSYTAKDKATATFDKMCALITKVKNSTDPTAQQIGQDFENYVKEKWGKFTKKDDKEETSETLEKTSTNINEQFEKFKAKTKKDMEDSVQNRQTYNFKVLELLYKIAGKHPELRLGQIISNAVIQSPEEDIFYIEPHVMYKRLTDYCKKYNIK